MEEYIKLINQVEELLDQADKIEDQSEKKKFFNKNMNVLVEFKDTLQTSLRFFCLPYQMEEFSTADIETDQNIVEKEERKLKNNIIRILNIKDVFQEESQNLKYKNNLIDQLDSAQNLFIDEIDKKASAESLTKCINHIYYIICIINTLNENNNFEGLENEGKNRRLNLLEQILSMIAESLYLIRKNFFNLQRKEIIEVLDIIEKLHVIEYISKKQKINPETRSNMITEYTMTILRLKSIFTPNTLRDDKLVDLFWNGKIKDIEVVSAIIDGLSLKAISNLLGQNSNESMIFELANHLEKIKFSDKDISEIIQKLLKKDILTGEMKKDISTDEVAMALAKIEIPDSMDELKKSQYAQKYPWIVYNSDIFIKLKEKEKEILDARFPYLPVEYYVKKLNSIDLNVDLSMDPHLDSHFVPNLLILLDSEYYTDDEKNILINVLKKKGLYDRQYNDIVEFDKNDSDETIIKKAKKIYLSGNIIPIDISIRIINNLIDHPEVGDEILVESCVQSIISNLLRQEDINIGNQIFFGTSDSKTNGWHKKTRNNEGIWIDRNLLEEFLDEYEMRDRANLFVTMFHEIQHSIQFHNIENGNIDYLTYNFIKEEVIRKYDEEFYNINYSAMYIEADARKEGILKSLSFLEGLNPAFVAEIKTSMNKELSSEMSNHNINLDANKSTRSV